MEIVEEGPVHLVGIEVTANWENLQIEMPKAWRTLFARYEQIKNRMGDDFMDVSLSAEDDQYIQLVAAQVFAFEDVPSDMMELDLPPQKYVYTVHSGPVEEIAKTFEEMYGWAKEHDIGVGDFKIDRGYRPEGDEKQHELYIRVVEGNRPV